MIGTRIGFRQVWRLRTAAGCGASIFPMPLPRLSWIENGGGADVRSRRPSFPYGIPFWNVRPVPVGAGRLPKAGFHQLFIDLQR